MFEEEKNGGTAPSGELLRARGRNRIIPYIIDRSARANNLRVMEGWDDRGGRNLAWRRWRARRQIPRFLQGRRKIANDMPGTAPVPDACRIGKSIVTAGAAIFLTRFTDISSIYIYIYSDAVFSSFLEGGEALLGWRPKDWLRISPDFSYISWGLLP